MTEPSTSWSTCAMRAPRTSSAAGSASFATSIAASRRRSTASTGLASSRAWEILVDDSLNRFSQGPTTDIAKPGSPEFFRRAAQSSQLVRRLCRSSRGPYARHDDAVTDREHDIVLHGATGFVGALLAAYLVEHAPVGLRIALSGRSREKLERTRAALPANAHGWPLVVADAADAGALARLAATARVVVSTVGPYAKYGLPLVEACSRAGTHYADLTGEVLFVREVIDRCDALARANGARIVHACGYDSIPSDLGTLLLHLHAGEDLARVQLVATVRGGISGGTLDSMREQLEAVGRDPALRRLAANPHALSPDPAAEPAQDQPSDTPLPAPGPGGMWTAPFVMAPFNTRIVRRSNALTGWSYGRALRYGEVMGCGKGPVGAAMAGGITVGLAAFVAAMSLPPARALLDRVLPAPGHGPSEQTREQGWFRSVLYGITTSGRRLRAEVSGRGDPGYAATVVMLAQSGLCLAQDDLPERAGSLTPATAMGMALIERLRSAGQSYALTTA